MRKPAASGRIWSATVPAPPSSRPGAPRVRFVTSGVLRAGFSQAGSRCALPSYVVSGDVVLTGHAEGAFTCAGFVCARGLTTIDFLPTASLSALPVAQQAPGDWVGHRTAPEQEITIRPGKGGALAVAGEATWGMGDPARQTNGGVNTGEVQGITRPVAGVLAFTQGLDRTLPYTAGDRMTAG